MNIKKKKNWGYKGVFRISIYYYYKYDCWLLPVGLVRKRSFPLLHPGRPPLIMPKWAWCQYLIYDYIQFSVYPQYIITYNPSVSKQLFGSNDTKRKCCVILYDSNAAVALYYIVALIKVMPVRIESILLRLVFVVCCILT